MVIIYYFEQVLNAVHDLFIYLPQFQISNTTQHNTAHGNENENGNGKWENRNKTDARK